MGKLTRSGGVGKATHALEPTDDSDSDDGWWRVLLLRGLVKGNLAGERRGSDTFRQGGTDWRLRVGVVDGDSNLSSCATRRSGGAARSGAH